VETAMNQQNHPNLITQNKQCCINCGKQYKQKGALKKHAVLCYLITRCDKLIPDKDDDIIPSKADLYNMILGLTRKYKKLETQLAEVSKHVVKDNKPLNIVEWLNQNKAGPSLSFHAFTRHIALDRELINSILNKSFNDIFTEIVKGHMLDAELPIMAFTQKKNMLFIFNETWKEIFEEGCKLLFNSLQLKTSKLCFEWKQSHQEELRSNDHLCKQYDKAIVKIMSVDYNNPKYYAKAKSIIYNNIHDMHDISM